MILMLVNPNDFDFLVGGLEVLNAMPDVPALPMFADRAIHFLAALSKEILADKRSRRNVDVVSYAYWIRKASLEEAKKKHPDFNRRIGRGVAFHIAPSNVPINFAVSMTSSILAGNVTLIRISDKKFEQADIICDAVNRLLQNGFREMKPYLCIVRYAHNPEITKRLSAICDIRIIWGGDRTIETIRGSAIPPRAVELTFADRHSLAVIHADEYLKEDPQRVAEGFYTDTYYTDQNACSSPRMVVWMGTRIEEARERFWRSLQRLVKRDYHMKSIQAVDKYALFCSLAMSGYGIHLISKENDIVRVQIDRIASELMEYKGSGGYFFEYIAQDLEEIIPVLTKQCQTVSVLGVSAREVKDLVFRHGVRGVDRIVPLGQTMGLEFVWDGFQMIEAMSRLVYWNF